MTTPATSDDFGYGNKRYWLDDQQIAIVVGAGDMRRESLDAWAEAVIDTSQVFPGTGSIFVLLQLDHPNQGFTPYSRHKVMDIYTRTSDRPSYVAVLLRNTLINLFITSFINNVQTNKLKPTMRTQVFTDHTKAVSWLRYMRQQEQQS